MHFRRISSAVRSTRECHRPVLESLEHRTLLSTCHVSRLGDFGGGMLFRGDLRYCINKTINDPGPDTIDFRVNGTVRLSSPLPELEGDLTILGPGAGLITIDAQQNARVFKIKAGANVQVSGVTLTGGFADQGGGVYNSGNATFQDCTITNNNGEDLAAQDFRYGGGIYNDGTLSITNCAITSNTMRGFYAGGGGIYNSGQLTIEKSTLSNNRAGAHFAVQGFGGGIWNIGNATIIDSTIASCLVIGNDVGGGSGIYNSSQGTLTVSGSLFEKNRLFAGNGLGSAIGNSNADATVINSTISDNLVANDIFTPVEASGGGISHAGGTLILIHSTIALNSANDFGGGVNIASGNAVLRNTIVAGNTANSGPDLYGNLGTSGNNLFGNSAGGSGYVGSDLLNVDPLLGALSANGGPTKTHALLAGSPAINTGDNTDAPEWDQRGPGYARIANGTIDIGAFEVQSRAAGSRPFRAPPPAFDLDDLFAGLNRRTD
jgi:hypothetical protein